MGDSDRARYNQFYNKIVTGVGPRGERLAKAESAAVNYHRVAFWAGR